ncbi:MAG: protein phosphatase 2C domain-containing protein [Deltaproteobacteria bacterium]|nr:protein phosphatase 2C domain-containing protein [Deltaproteobacteria bacterium]
MSRPNETIPPLYLHCAGLTHQGIVRTDNEDAFGMRMDLGLFVVADGMGGRSAGDVAARITVEEMEAFFTHRVTHERDPWPYPMSKQASLGANILNVGLKVANAAIRAAAARAPELNRMAATAVALAIGQTQLSVAHVGDARAYRLREGKLSRLTRDHSVVEEMKAARPDISEAALAAMAPKNVVTRALGSKDDVEPTVYQKTFMRQDTYLLCSDGLWGELPDATIEGLLNQHRDLEEACQHLIDAANAAGGKDNVSVILLRVD